MDAPIARNLKDFPEHAKLIGDMLLGYSDMEILILRAVSVAIGSDLSTAARAIFSLRGAEDRLNVIDAILHQHMSATGLKGAYSLWLGAMRRCKQIRNQYAHCLWLDNHNRLWFASLTDLAQSKEGAATVDFKPVDLPLLEEQYAYFAYALEITVYLSAETRFRRDRRRRHQYTLPKSRAVPRLHSPRR